MFKVILGAIVALAFSAAYAEETPAPAAPTENTMDHAAAPAAEHGAMEHGKMDGKMKKAAKKAKKAAKKAEHSEEAN